MKNVIVVGAGVSGCACAATLATAGVQVTLMNSAMDRVGLPAYGPDLVGADGSWEGLERSLALLPLPLRRAWLEAAMKPAGGGAVINIDRRRISIETKRVLERLTGLEFRQGFVVDLRVPEPRGADRVRQQVPLGAAGASGAKIEVETIFGEIFAADAAVVAVGLSLGGRAAVGRDIMAGGRYGEPSSEGLVRALEELGAEFGEVSLELGPRVPQRSLALLDGGRNACQPAEEPAYHEKLVPAARNGALEPWPADYPPAPHWNPSLRATEMICVARTSGASTEESRRHERRDALKPLVSPDGAATSEVYVAPSSAAATLIAGHAAIPAMAGDLADESDAVNARGRIVATRMAHTVSAKVVGGLTPAGQMMTAGSPGAIWVVGRAAGAEDYAQSIASGVQAAKDIAAWLETRNRYE